jgi:hypothetical protein
MEKHIRTTHVGSLPRNAKLTDLLIRQELGDAVDSAEPITSSKAGGLIGNRQRRF